MSKNWYVLHVLTGAELEVQRYLQKQGIAALVLREIVLLRCSGQWHEEARTLFPGYVFLYIKYTPAIFHAIKNTPAAIRLLPKDNPMPLLPQDCAWLATFADQEILPPTKVDFSRKGTPIILDGPLEAIKKYIVKFDRHRRKVMLRIPVLGEAKDITLSILPV